MSPSKKKRKLQGKTSKETDEIPADRHDNAALVEIKHAGSMLETNLMSLPMELYSLIISNLKAKVREAKTTKGKANVYKRDLSAISQTCSVLHAWTIPLLYRNLVVRVSPEHFLCFPPRPPSPKRRRSRLSSDLGSGHDEETSSTDVHKLLHANYDLCSHVRQLHVVRTANRLPSWHSVSRAISHSGEDPYEKLFPRVSRSSRGIRKESIISLNIAMLVERMPKLAMLCWRVESFMGEILQAQLCKSLVSTIEVRGEINNCYRPSKRQRPVSFLHYNRPVILHIPTLTEFRCEDIGDSLHLQQIGRLIGLNSSLEKLMLSLCPEFKEEIVSEGPEGLGVLIRAIVEAQKAFILSELASPALQQQRLFALRTIHLSMFTLDEDAEEGLGLMLGQCPLETLVLEDVACSTRMTLFFRIWSGSKTLLYLHHLILLTDSVDEHAIDFVALVKFLLHLGNIPHRFQSLELLGGWKLLGFGQEHIDRLKASKIVHSLTSLIWESCVTPWCQDCEVSRTARAEMWLFASLAGCCTNLISLGLPGLFLHTGLGNHENPTARDAMLETITGLPRLRHLHIQKTDRHNRAWSRRARAPTPAPAQYGPNSAGIFEDVSFHVKSSPRLRPVDPADEQLFYLVARALAIASLGRSVQNALITTGGLERHRFFTITFGRFAFHLLAWGSCFVKRRPGGFWPTGHPTAASGAAPPQFAVGGYELLTCKVCPSRRPGPVFRASSSKVRSEYEALVERADPRRA